MKTDEHDPLWDLLGKAKQPGVSPFFARNVLREIRQTQQERVGFFTWVRRSWRVAVPVGAAAMVALMSTSVFHQHPQKQEHSPVLAQIVGNPDYEVINHLDELLASEENAVWTDDSVN